MVALRLGETEYRSAISFARMRNHLQVMEAIPSTNGDFARGVTLINLEIHVKHQKLDRV